ncbi:hypothetical protein ADK65_19020 [Streptomyces sp. NRRL B-1140]|uniref:hypothetical protein n=1 Tax=Streptomyces sp. NRRL B-1140 TaxID=1415549 RepID=UPI0006AE8455|nr:hypothetical protein [Streptomyces sp. NRRL B-1140]KOV99052.1 hypothetical protein ADK65_19020 [Streptomyces sp. NRRL B-1140]
MRGEPCAVARELGVRKVSLNCPASGNAEAFASVPSMRTLWGEGTGHPNGGSAPATTAGQPSSAALGLAGGDGTEPADALSGLPEVRVRHHKPDRLRLATSTASSSSSCATGGTPPTRPDPRPPALTGLTLRETLPFPPVRRQ